MDWEYVNVLLSVIHAAAQAGPKYSKIGAKADEELWAHFNPEPIVEEPATYDPQAEAPSEVPPPIPPSNPTIADRRI